MVATAALCILGIETIAGTGARGFAGDGEKASEARLNGPTGVGRGPDGAIYFCDTDNQRIRRIAKDGTISTFAGNGTKGHEGDGGPAVEASLNQPYELAWDPGGNLYFVEIGSHVVRRVDALTKRISTYAGTGKLGFGGDGGPAVEAQFNQPHSLAFDAHGDLLICDIGNHRIRKISTRTKEIQTWAGNGTKRTSPNGTVVGEASLNGPRAISFDRAGNAWVALREGNSILRIDAKTQTIEKVAGTGKSGFSGNGGPALAATLSGPKGIAVGGDGRIYIADTESHSIRVYDPRTKTIDVVVGTGIPSELTLHRPHGIFVDRDGTLLIGDTENHRIRSFKM